MIDSSVHRFILWALLYLHVITLSDHVQSSESSSISAQGLSPACSASALARRRRFGIANFFSSTGEASRQLPSPANCLPPRRLRSASATVELSPVISSSNLDRPCQESSSGPPQFLCFGCQHGEHNPELVFRQQSFNACFQLPLPDGWRCHSSVQQEI